MDWESALKLAEKLPVLGKPDTDDIALVSRKTIVIVFG